mmetsp:Transcript_26434/g.43947  ORF Transcript_26434/g.43947 Transcript_26434/m.43947 type:complete len:94 (-) Transcript_26434:313-594(-)
MLAKQRQAQLENTLRVGLNKMGGGGAAIGPNTVSSGATIGAAASGIKAPRRCGAAARPCATAGITEDDGDYEWQPPQDQTGDGRSTLNAKLGY